MKHGQIAVASISGTPLKTIPGLNCFIGKGIDKKTWYVWEFTCGFDFAWGNTKKEAIEQATQVWNGQGQEGFGAAIANASKQLIAAKLFPVNSYR